MRDGLDAFHDPTLPPVVMPACPIEKKLKGQKALVTGASSGIGKGIAIGLGHAGADVVVNYVSGPADAEAVVEEVKSCGGSNAYAHRCDVSNEDEVRQMFDRMRREFSTVDILVNNAGLQQDAPFVEMSLAQWNKVISVNLTGQFLCTREAVREFKRRGAQPGISCSRRKDHLHLIGARRHPLGGPRQLRGVEGRRCDDDEIDRAGGPRLFRIRVNAICPGAVSHANQHAGLEESCEAYAELMKLVPYKRIGEVDDIARAAVWLASDDIGLSQQAPASYVDGGMTLYPGFETGG